MKLGSRTKRHYPSADAEIIAAGKIFVDIIANEGEDLEATTESIGIVVCGMLDLELTWAEARDLSRALKLVEGVARNG